MEKKKDSMRFYDAAASSYEELYGKEQEAKYDAALKAVGTTYLGKILDVGCGPALFLRRIVSPSTLSVGVDTSHGMLMNTRAKDTNSLNLLCADADFLPIRDEVFDSVFAFTLLQNMPDPASTLREILRVAQAGGLIVITLPKSEAGPEASLWLTDVGIPYREVDVDSSSKDHIYIYRKARGHL